MVDVIDAYRIVNTSILRVAEDLVILAVMELPDRSSQIRLEEAAYSVAEIRNRIDGNVIVAHDLSQYTNKFYSITLNTGETVWLDYRVGHNMSEIDLTEFGEYV